MVLEGTLNRQRYIGLIRDSMLPWVTGVLERNFVYVQGDAMPHTARNMTAFLAQQNVEWPQAYTTFPKFCACLRMCFVVFYFVYIPQECFASNGIITLLPN